MQRLSRLLILLCCLFSAQAYGQVQPVVQGDAVVTCGAINAGDPVLAVIKAQAAGLQALNVNWGAPMFHHAEWNRDSMGQVFGIALDGRGNIYVTASVAYPIDVFGPGGSGAVYRIDATTNDVTTFATLPNPSGVGLGNICWDPDYNPPGSTNGQFFVTNFEDGRIYRINGTTGAVILPAFDPFAADLGATTFAPRGERLWGIAYRRPPAAPGVSRIYFGRWQEDMGNVSPFLNNQIFSVGRNNITGALDPGTLQLEINIPPFPTANPFPPGVWSNPPADIEFSGDGRRMLIAERGWASDANGAFNNAAHCARLLEYVAIGAGWGPGNVFNIGQITVSGIQANSAGGADYGYRTFDTTTGIPGNCDSTVWGSGNALHFDLFLPDFIYGEQMLPATGGGIANSVLIDLDGSFAWHDMKNYIGDIDILKNCALAPPPCDKLSLDLTSTPNPTGACCWGLNITNGYLGNYWEGVHLTMLTPGAEFTSSIAPGGWSAVSSPATIIYTPNVGHIPFGASGLLQFCIDPDTTTSQQIVVTWVGNDGRTCRDTITTTCGGGHPCGELTGIELKCITAPPATPSYSMTFSVTNNSTSTTYNSATVVSTTMGSNVTTPFISFPTLPPTTTSTPKTVTIVGGAPGTVVCLTITLSSTGKKDACTFDTCIVLPRCPDCCDSLNLRVTQVGAISSSVFGIVQLNQLFTTAPHYISKFTATLVSATKATWCKLGAGSTPEAPVAATFAYGVLGGIAPSTPYGTGELSWGTYFSGVLLNNTPGTLRLKFPPLTGSKCVDTLRFCIKYTFTDTLCRTCDTTICYRVIRKGLIFFLDDVRENDRIPFGTEGDGVDDPGKTSDEERSLLSFGSSGKPIYITMASETAGTLTIQNLIEANDDPNLSMTIVGVVMEPEVGVDITQMSDNTGLQLATIADRVATINPLVAPITPGETRTFSLAYDNTVNATAFTNYLKVYYTIPEYGSEILEATVAVYARTPLGFGGDILEADKNVQLENVRTYGLRFENANSTGDEIARVEITIADGKGDGDDIVAVGPGIDRTRVHLKSFQTNAARPRVLLLPEEPSEDVAMAVPMESGTVVTPIYITVCGGLDDKVEFDYTTFNAANEVISTGTVAADEPLMPGPAGVDDPSVPGVQVSALDCLPNPATETTTFSFTLPRPEASVWLLITDMTGGEVARVINGDAMAAGPHEVIFDVSKLPSGAYLYTLRTKDQVQTRQIQIVR